MASCGSRCGPTSCARGATSASGGSRRRSPARRRPDVRHADRRRVPPLPARSEGAAGHGDAGRRRLRPQVRRAGAGGGDHRPRHAGSPPPRASSSTSTGPSGRTPATPTACCGTPSSTARRRARTRSRSGCCRPTSPTAATSATPTCWSTRRSPPGSTHDGVRRCLDTDEGRVEVEARPGATPPSPASPPCPTYVIDRRWSIPGAQDPDVFVQVLRRLAARRRRRLTCPTDRLAADAAPGAADGVVLVHGFTQTARSWDRRRRHARRRPRGRRRRRARPRRLGRRSRPTSSAGADAARRDRRAGDVRRLLDGRAAVPAPRPRPGPTSSSGSCWSAPPPASTTRPSAPPGGRRRGAGGVDRARRARRLPRPAGSPSRCSPGSPDPGLDDRRRNTAAGLASSLRLAGTGTQAAAVGPARRARRCRCCSSPARATPSSSPPPSGWPALLPAAELAVVPGAGHTVHLERPDAFVDACLVRDWLARSPSLGPSSCTTPPTSIASSDGSAPSTRPIVPARRTAAGGGRWRRAPRSAPGRGRRRAPRAGGTASGDGEQARAAPTAATTAAHHGEGERRARAARRTATGSGRRRGARRACACRRAVSVGMSRRLLTTSRAHARQPGGAAHHHAERGDPLDRHVRRADRRHQPEEHEHEHLAEPEVAVRPRARRCSTTRRRSPPPRRRAATTTSSPAQRQPGHRGHAERGERGPLHRAPAAEARGDEPERADPRVVGAAHAVAVVVGVVHADLQGEADDERDGDAPPRDDAAPTAQPAPMATGTTAAGSVRGRAPSDPAVHGPAIMGAMRARRGN